MKVALFFEFTKVGFQLPCRGYVACCVRTKSIPPYQFLYVAIYLLPSSTVSVIETFDFSHPGGVVTEVFAMVVIAFLFGWPEFLTPCLSLIGLRSSYF